MTWLKWFKRDGVAVRKPPAPPAARRPTPRPAVAEVALEAALLDTSWHPESGRLVASAAGCVPRGARVAVQILGPGKVMSPLTGSVAAALPDGEGAALEIELDQDQRPAVDRLLAYLRTGRDAPRVRAPRYRVSLPAFVSSGGASVYMTAVSLSRGGCGLAWMGAPPRIGSVLLLRLGSGSGSASFRGMVCWVRALAGGLRVGVRFVSGQEGSLVALLKAANAQ